MLTETMKNTHLNVKIHKTKSCPKQGTEVSNAWYLIPRLDI